jgi:starch synthase (maltosyl-transferring)
MVPFITRVNEIRRAHPAFARLSNVRFHGSADDAFLVWSKGSVGDGDLVLMVVNLDPHNPRETVLDLDLGAMGLPWSGPLHVHDELGGDDYTWDGPRPYVRLDPTQRRVAHILTLRA